MLNHRNFWLKFNIFIATMLVADLCDAAPFSKYGLIQSVPNYSSSPFYDNKTGTITTPQMVYATGPVLKPSDCERAVESIVDAICRQKNYCRNVSLSDIRPNIMVQLSLLPGYNYASSCAGYMDTIFDNYKKRYSYNDTGVSGASFPNATTTYSDPSKNSKTNKKTGYQERADELKALQAQTSTENYVVTQTDFPKTFDDLSFQEKNKIKWEGYEPYKDAKVYVPLNVERSKDKNAYRTTTEVQAEETDELKTCLTQYEEALTAADAAYQTAYRIYQAYSDMQTWATQVIKIVEVTNSIPEGTIGKYDPSDGTKFLMYLARSANPKDTIPCTLDGTDAKWDKCLIAPKESAQKYCTAKSVVKMDMSTATTNYDNAKTALETALKNDHNSACICTYQKRFRDDALKQMDVKCKADSPTENEDPAPTI